VTSGSLPSVLIVEDDSDARESLAELIRQGCIPNSVTTVNLAGEPLTSDLVDDIYRTTSVRKVYDLYGPSEDTTYSTFALRERGGRETIGRPITNTQVFLLDKGGRPVPVGVPGDLHITGAGLARGYLNRPDLTAEKFVPNSFAQGVQVFRSSGLQVLRFPLKHLNT